MRHIKMSFWDEREAKKLLQELPFYNALIEKTRIKCLKNIDLLQELPILWRIKSCKNTRNIWKICKKL